jgi:hypothetical protein
MDYRDFSALPPETQDAIRQVGETLGIAKLGLAEKCELLARVMRRSLAEKKRAEELRRRRHLRAVRPPEP